MKLFCASASRARAPVRCARADCTLLSSFCESSRAHELAGPHGVTDVQRPFEQPAIDAEGLVDLGLRLHRARQRDRFAGRALVYGDGAHGSNFRSDLLLGPLAGRQQRDGREREDGDRGRQATAVHEAASPGGEIRKHETPPSGQLWHSL